ncbi:MAG: hypothetical protein ACI9EZ_002208, partial [Halobacteriales archaeon]
MEPAEFRVPGIRPKLAQSLPADQPLAGSSFGRKRRLTIMRMTANS